MTDAEYQAQKADLDAQQAALETEWASSQEYPRWLYHETEPPQIVQSEAEAEALGAGWSPSPGGPAVEPTAKRGRKKADAPAAEAP